MENPQHQVIGRKFEIRRELDEIRIKKRELEDREKELHQQMSELQKNCTHKNADGTSAVEYVGPGYDGCRICGEWF